MIDPLTGTGLALTLFQVWLHERDQAKQASRNEFLEWLEQHRHNEVKDLLIHNALLSEGIEKLSQIGLPTYRLPDPRKKGLWFFHPPQVTGRNGFDMECGDLSPLCAPEFIPVLCPPAAMNRRRESGIEMPHSKNRNRLHGLFPQDKEN